MKTSLWIEFFLGIFFGYIVTCGFSLTTGSLNSRCTRFHLRGLDPKYTRRPQLQGIYRLTDMLWNDFPVLEKEDTVDDKEYFYYFENEKKKWFLIGSSNQTSSGVGALALKSDKAEFMSLLSSNNEPYKHFIGRWFDLDPNNSTYYLIDATSSDKIGLECVSDKSIFPCRTGNFRLNTTITASGHVFHQSVFKVVKWVYKGLRPVYKSAADNMYLFYNAKHSAWVIGKNYHKNEGHMYVDDTALSPEFITNHVWHYANDYGKWLTTYKLSLDCYYIPLSSSISSASCSSSNARNLCSNNGDCFVGSLNEVKCKCDSGFTGVNCDIKLKTCPKPTIKDLQDRKSSSAAYTTMEQGSLLSYTCAKGLSPNWYFSVCSDGQWRDQDYCRKPFIPTTARPKITTRKSYYPFTTSKPETTKQSVWDYLAKNYEEPSWIWILVMCLQIFFEIIGPIFVWLCLPSKFDDFGVLRTYSLCYWVLMVFYTPIIIFCVETKCGKFSSTLGVFSTVGAISMIFFLILMWIDSYRCPERHYLANIAETKSITDFIMILRQTPPMVVWKIECYHYETRTRTVYYTDAQGNTQSRIETYQEIVVTYTETTVFQYNYWKDVSATVVEGIHPGKITRIQMTKDVQPGDDETVSRFYAEQNAFIDENKYRDVHYNFMQEIFIEGFQKHIAVYSEKSQKPWWMRSLWFWIFSLIGLTWPYRWLFNYSTAKTNYSLVKEIFMSKPNEEPLVEETDIRRSMGTLKRNTLYGQTEIPFEIPSIKDTPDSPKEIIDSSNEPSGNTNPMPLQKGVLRTL